MAAEGHCFHLTVPKRHMVNTLSVGHRASYCQHPAPTQASSEERHPNRSCPLSAPTAPTGLGQRSGQAVRGARVPPQLQSPAPSSGLLQSGFRGSWAPTGHPGDLPPSPLPHRQALGRTVLPPFKTPSLGPGGGSLQWTQLFWEEAAHHLSGLIRVIVEIIFNV